MKQKFKESFKKIIDYSNAVDAELREDIDSLEKCRKYINTELDYFGIGYNPELTNTQTTLKANTVCDGLLSLFGIVKTNMDTVDDTYVTLKGGKKYNIKFDCTAYSSTIVYCITEDGTKIGLGYLYKGSYSCSGLDIIYEPIEDTNITIIVDTTVNIYAREGQLTITEIGRITTIDPVEHINTTQGLEDTPVGHIISHMGTIAPKHYLICDGTEYNILDYPYLAEHIKSNFGSYNYFGGDGEDTFAVPDLRAEFLRGAGTATRNTGSGGEVGVHQDATEHMGTYIADYGKGLYTPVNASNKAASATNPDVENKGWTGLNALSGSYLTKSSYSTLTAMYTSRPTNTSVLYCIKYEPTYYMNIFGLREKVILFEGASHNSNTITLTDNINNYDEIYIECCVNCVSQDFIITIDGREGSYLRRIIDRGGGNGSSYASITIMENTVNVVHTLTSVSWPFVLSKVIGIRYGSTTEGESPLPSYSDEEIQTSIADILETLNSKEEE